MGLDKRDIRLIGNLYWNQCAGVWVDGQISDEVSVMKGVRQGCILSPLQYLFKKNFPGCSRRKEPRCEGEWSSCNNIRYGYDTVLLTTSLADLQGLLDSVAAESSATNRPVFPNLEAMTSNGSLG
ncbi:hypothetical protein JRQ81_006327, partial [Phrynocephalus forsythii]